MNILIIPSWYSTDNNPTNGSFFREQSLALKRAGHNVVVGFVEVVSTKTTCVTVVNDNGISIYRIKQHKLKKTGNIGTVLAYAKGLKEIINIAIKKYKFDIIHVHSVIWAGYGVARISRKYNIPFVITEHSSYFGRYKSNFIEKFIFRYVFRKAEKVICVSNSLKNEIRIYNKNSIVIPNMVSFEKFRVGKVQKSEEFIFLSICYLKKNKNMDVLIEGFNKYFKDSNSKLIIGGDGPERANLEKLVFKLGISEQVIFKGSLTRKEVVDIINYSDVMVLPSTYETFGVVLIEALACGKPIISTYNGGAEDVVEKSNGRIVEINNYDALGEAMMDIYTNYYKYDKSKIIENAFNNYSECNVVKKIENVYIEILKN